MAKSIYNTYLLYKFDVLEIVGIQINDILTLANDVYTSNIKKAIKAIKIMIKDCKYFTFVQLIKFNRI